MPILVIPPNNFTEATCNYQHPEENQLVEIDLEDTTPLKNYADRYEKITKDKIETSESSKLIHYSNFLASRMKNLLETEGCFFIRVFNAIHDNGKHFMFIVPVDNTGKPIKTRDTIYLGPCCACPPSCIASGGLG